MKIIKVIVDELPNTCWDCARLDFDFKGVFKKECPYCLITGGDIMIDYKSTRPDWCPLILRQDVIDFLMQSPTDPNY